MSRKAYKFAPARPGASKTHAELVKVYLAAHYSVSDAERKAAGDVEAGRLRNAVEKAGDEAEVDCRLFQQRLVQRS